MFRRLFHLISLVAVLCMAGNASADLILNWRFDGGSGFTAYDSSGNGNDGTLEGNPMWVAGKIGVALDFGGDGDRVLDETAGDYLNGLEAMTVCLWIRSDVVGTDKGFIIFADPNGEDNSNMRYDAASWQWTGGRNLIKIAVSSTGGFQVYESSDNTQTREWQHVAMVWSSGNELMLYIDAELDAPRGTDPGIVGTVSGVTKLIVGQGSKDANGGWDGLIDDVRIYNEALSAADIQAAMVGEGYPYAMVPSPVDGAMHEDTWVSLTWRPGDFALSHDVYFSDSFNDVNDGAGDAFQGNQTQASYIAGLPGFAYPDGLIPGTTYCWRIDEVNEADPNSPWKGPVWSFWIPPKEAYNPSPADGTMFVSTNVTLEWTGGSGAKLHTVYFGDNFDDVSNAAGGVFQGATTFTPGPLEFNKTYYWRVDEFDPPFTHTGDVWSFTTTIEGLGKAVMDRWEDISGSDIEALKDDPNYPNNPDVTETVTRFAWNGANLRNYGARIEAWLYIPLTGDYTFWLNSDDHGELWLSTDDDPSNVVLIARESSHTDFGSWGSGEEQSDPISLVGGDKYYISALWKEGIGNDHCQVAWQGPGVPERIVIPGSNLSPFEPMAAFGAKPANRAAAVTQRPTLKWKPGLAAASHEVYFGTEEEAVKNATEASPEYKGGKSLGDESFDPGKLPWESTFFWRVDEVNDLNPESPWVGKVWRFTTAGFFIVDDFEDYTDDDPAGEAIWQRWIDGFGVSANGSQVGYVQPPYAEKTIVHGGRQSMPLSYNNIAGVTNSEAELKLGWPRDWTEGGVATLSIWFRGQPASTGSFTEDPVDTFTMTGSGANITGNADEFHFAYKRLTGAGTIIARVDSVQDTDDWAKAGVMIRETLDPGSRHAFAAVTSANGVASQGRVDTGARSFNYAEDEITAPHWVKLERDQAGNFAVFHSADGSTWVPVKGAVPENIQMRANVYVGLAVTSHNTALTCEAVFSNVTITGNVGAQQWVSQDIGIASNVAEPMYVEVSNATGSPVVVVHEDPSAAQIETWTQWTIDLSTFSDQGINLSDVDKIAIGLGSKGGATADGGSGVVFFDDIRLLGPTTALQP